MLKFNYLLYLFCYDILHIVASESDRSWKSIINSSCCRVVKSLVVFCFPSCHFLPLGQYPAPLVRVTPIIT